MLKLTSNQDLIVFLDNLKNKFAEEGEKDWVKRIENTLYYSLDSQTEFLFEAEKVLSEIFSSHFQSYFIQKKEIDEALKSIRKAFKSVGGA